MKIRFILIVALILITGCQEKELDNYITNITVMDEVNGEIIRQTSQVVNWTTSWIGKTNNCMPNVNQDDLLPLFTDSPYNLPENTTIKNVSIYIWYYDIQKPYCFPGFISIEKNIMIDGELI